MLNKLNLIYSPMNAVKYKEILGHVGFWMVYLLLPFLKSITRQSGYNFYNELNDFCFGLLAFYSAYYLFKLQNRRNWFFLILGLLYVGIGYLNFQIHNLIFGGTHQEYFLSYYAIGYISTYCVLASFAYLLYSIKESHARDLKLQVALREKEKIELSLLKAQINPHFLFNTINTIYKCALNKEDKTADLILKLSDNFRYVISEGNREKVSLEKEIKHLKDYIFLQKERLGEKIKVNFTENIDDYEQTIAPLILITFVENMFKHSSLLKGKQHQLKIDLSFVDSLLSFSCENPYNVEVGNDISRTNDESGIGIKTTTKRLAFSYPNKHQLAISMANGIYSVELKIQL